MDKMPFEDASVDMIVSHHTLEHFGCGEADSCIDEWHRLLRVGGSLIVCVPDMRALAQAYLLRNIDTQIYMTNLYGAYMGDEADRHKWGYDPGSLHAYLMRWQWKIVKQFNFRQIPGADIAQAWWVLAMECIK
jgi:predicted SAM-dependent methyltransferase